LAVYPLLALLWAIVLVPPMVRRRVKDRAEFAEFDRMRLCFVGSTAAASQSRNGVSLPPVRRTATQRRRRVLALIGASMVATLLVAVVLRTRVAWGMHLLVYDVLIAYVGLLARARDKQPSRRPVAVPALQPVAGPSEAVRSVPTARPRRMPRSVPFPTPASPALPELLHAASR